MNDYILLMHNDSKNVEHNSADKWAIYIEQLQRAGAFQGGSAIGRGVCLVKAGAAPEVTSHLSGYIRVRAASLDQARELVQGNPVFEAGGTVEVRELPTT